MRVLLVSANRELLPAPVVPLGVLSVAAAARREHDVHVLDLCFEPDPHQALAQALKRLHPDVVGVGLRNLHTNAYDGSERLVAGYRELVSQLHAQSRAPVVLGGAGFSLQPKRLLDALGADHGVVGEGELAFVELLARLRAERRAPKLVRGGPGPMPARRRRFESDLDLLPRPARDLVDPRYYAFDGTDNLQTKRGCAFGCSYCDYPDLEGRKVRTRDPNAVADEVALCAEHPEVTHLFFVDSVFNVPRAHAFAVCQALEARGAPLPWAAYVSPASLDEQLVAQMARAGCVGVELGTDTGSEVMLKRLKKPFDLAQVVRAHEAFVRHGILDCHTFVLGAQGETVEEVQQTLEFVDRLQPAVAVFIVFMEDREAKGTGHAKSRAAILELLKREAPRRPGWVVPELDHRFGAKLTALLRRGRLKGPAWLHLARLQKLMPMPAWNTRGLTDTCTTLSPTWTAS